MFEQFLLKDTESTEMARKQLSSSARPAAGAAAALEQVPTYYSDVSNMPGESDL